MPEKLPTGAAAAAANKNDISPSISIFLARAERGARIPLARKRVAIFIRCAIERPGAPVHLVITSIHFLGRDVLEPIHLAPSVIGTLHDDSPPPGIRPVYVRARALTKIDLDQTMMIFGNHLERRPGSPARLASSPQITIAPEHTACATIHVEITQSISRPAPLACGSICRFSQVAAAAAAVAAPGGKQLVLVVICVRAAGALQSGIRGLLVGSSGRYLDAPEGCNWGAELERESAS